MTVPYWRAFLPVLVTAVTLGAVSPASAAPEGTMTWGVHITLASRWLDPAETEGIITPFMVLSGLQDAVGKAMPARPHPPQLGAAGKEIKGRILLQVRARKGRKVPQWCPRAAGGGEVSFERYKGAGVKLLKERVREVQIV